jgi:hypothetical protein
MTTEAAFEIWKNMNPMQRADVMAEVGYMKSITKRLRLCIAHIQAAA